MKRRHILILAISAIAIIIAIILFHRGTRVEPYKEYSPIFQQRGQIKSTEKFPKNASDSAYLLQMEQLQFKDEIRHELNTNKINWNDIIYSVTLIIGALVAIITLLFKWTDTRRTADILDLKQVVIDNHTQNMNANRVNIEQHEKIYDKLTLVDNIELRKNVTDALTFVAKKHIHYNGAWLPAEMKLLINSQTQRVIELSEEIMTEYFDIETLSLTEVKIDERTREAWKQVTELFGCDFLVKYKEGQAKAINDFKKRLSDIAYGNIINSKYDRYRASAELFLHDIIGNTLAEYKLFTETNQNETKAPQNI